MQSAEVPPRGVWPMTAEFIESNSRHDLSLYRSALRYSGPTRRMQFG